MAFFIPSKSAFSTIDIFGIVRVEKEVSAEGWPVIPLFGLEAPFFPGKKGTLSKRNMYEKDDSDLLCVRRSKSAA